MNSLAGGRETVVGSIAVAVALDDNDSILTESETN
jgi:hypothetical protein